MRLFPLFFIIIIIISINIIMPRTRKAGRKSRRRRRAMPWAGWSKIAPQGHARTVMLRKCGKKCFLGPRKSFPICAKGTCKVNTKGLYAAYIRARQWGKKKSHYKGRSRPSMKRRVYTRVSRMARDMLRDRGALRGGRRRRRRTCRHKKLTGQRRSRSGKITRHGHYKCVSRKRKHRRSHRRR